MDMKNMFYNVAIKIAARKWTGHQREAIQILVNCNNDRQVETMHFMKWNIVLVIQNSAVLAGSDAILQKIHTVDIETR